MIEADISALDIYYIIGKDIGNVKNRVSSKSRFMSGHDESKYQLPINLIQQTFEILTFPKKYVHKFLFWFLWLSFGVRFWPVNNQTKSWQALNDIQSLDSRLVMIRGRLIEIWYGDVRKDLPYIIFLYRVHFRTESYYRFNSVVLCFRIYICPDSLELFWLTQIYLRGTYR